MKYYTEKEAKKKWCPRVQIFVDTAGNVYTNRGETASKLDDWGLAKNDIPELTRCIGPGCAAWEEGPEVEKTDGALSEKIDRSTGRVKLVATGRCGWKG